jgi:hypothetical protein
VLDGRSHDPDARPVRFGLETTDEMCFIIAFFTRDDETEPVQSSQCLPAKSGLLCPFAPVVTD